MRAIFSSDGGFMASDGQPARPDVSVAEVLSYDFTRAPQIAAAWWPRLQSFQAAVAESLSAELDALLHTHPEIESLQPVMQRFSEAWSLSPNPSCFAQIQLQEGHGPALCVLDQEASAALLDRLLGGASSTPAIPKPVTEIERRLLSAVFRQAAVALDSGWKGIAPCSLERTSACSAESVPEAIPPENAVVLTRFGIQLGSVSGVLSFFLPETLFADSPEPTSSADTPATSKSEGRREFLEHLSPVRLRVEATLECSSVTVRDLLSIENGDVLVLNHHVSQPVTLRVNGIPKLGAMPAPGVKQRALAVVAGLCTAPHSDMK
jgi:flagellar motor switch protein FliM